MDLKLIRGPVIVAAGLALLLTGVYLFDTSYQKAEYMMKEKLSLLSNTAVEPGKFANFTITSTAIHEHNVVIIHITPTSGRIQLDGIEPSGMTFEKQSSDGFLYHVIQRNAQAGSYSVKISNVGDKTVSVDAFVGEDPYLSNTCAVVYGTKCNIVSSSTGMVAIGLVALIVGIVVSIFDFKAAKKI